MESYFQLAKYTIITFFLLTAKIKRKFAYGVLKAQGSQVQTRSSSMCLSKHSEQKSSGGDLIWGPESKDFQIRGSWFFSEFQYIEIILF